MALRAAEGRELSDLRKLVGDEPPPEDADGDPTTPLLRKLLEAGARFAKPHLNFGEQTKLLQWLGSTIGKVTGKTAVEAAVEWRRLVALRLGGEAVGEAAEVSAEQLQQLLQSVGTDEGEAGATRKAARRKAGPTKKPRRKKGDEERLWLEPMRSAAPRVVLPLIQCATAPL